MRITLLLPLLLPFLLISSFLHAQENHSSAFSITAGPNFTELMEYDANDALGYFLSINTEGMLTKAIGYEGSLQFTNYHYGDLNYKALEPAFYFKVYPTSDFYFLAGFQLSKIFRATMDGDKVDFTHMGTAFYTVGAGYDFSDNWGLIYRFNQDIDDGGFGYSMQLGLKYKF